MGSIFFLLLAVVACSNTATPSPTVVTSSAVPPTPPAIPTPSPTASPLPTVPATPSPLPTATPSPRPMAPATLKPGPSMTVAREGQAAVRLGDGRVLVMGGTLPLVGKCEMACAPPVTASVEIFDPKTRKFSLNGSLAEPRSGAEALLLDDGRVLVYGGFSDGTIEMYDPAKSTSVVVKPPAGLKELPADPTVVKLADGRVLIAGGSYDEDASTSNVTLIFDPVSGGFSNGPLMAKPRQGATATLLDDGRVLIAGGDTYEGYYGNANSNAELIDPSSPMSEATLVSSRDYPSSSTLLSDGRVLVAEWAANDSGAACVTLVAPEVFDPTTETFTPAGQMNTPRYLSAAIRTQDGRVLFLGGLDSKCAAVGTVEAFDPDSGTFQVIATGFPTTNGFSATLLDDGEILIAGGSVNNAWNGATAASWLLKP
jgi:WD40 repeat protein